MNSAGMRLLICVLTVLNAVAALPSVHAREATVSASIEIPRPYVYVNEVFDLTLVVESYGVQLAQSMQLQPGPEKAILVTGEFQSPPEERSIRDGKVFIRRRFRCAARATQEGELTIAPSLLVTQLHRVRAFIGTAWRETPRTLQVKPQRLTVKPLPSESRPERWSGAIGRFVLDVRAEPGIVAVGDLVTVRSEIKGKGYTEGLLPPRVREASHFKTYEPRQTSQSSELLGYAQVVIPQSTNAVAVPPVSFCFFDPVAETYRTVTAGPFPLTFQARAVVTEQAFSPREAALDGLGGPPLRDTRIAVQRGVLAVGLACGLLCGVAGGINVVRRRKRRALLWTCGMLLCIGGFWTLHVSQVWESASLELERDVSARIAPSPTALACSELSKGGWVTVVERQGSWVRVRHGSGGGWIPAAALGAE